MNNYLQRICVLLQQKECGEAAWKMKALVEKQGLFVDVIFLQKDMPIDNLLSSYFGKDYELSASKERILFLSDDNESLSRLKQRNQAVLAYFHEHNKEERFEHIPYGCEEIENLNWSYFERVYRRCRNLPWDILETNRCMIRETTIEDVDCFYEIYKEPSITKYMEPLFPEKEQEIAYIEDYIKNVYEFYDFGVWTVLLKETGEVIGRAGISYRDGCDIPELGFVIALPWQRKGIAFEVCQAILEYGKEEFGFREFQALVEGENVVSIHLCEKLGFHQEELVTVDDKKMHRMLWNRMCQGI